MEHAQRVFCSVRKYKQRERRLNPYFNGTCSKRKGGATIKGQSGEVLILILMEHAQRDNRHHRQHQAAHHSLNPYFNGTCSKS